MAVKTAKKSDWAVCYAGFPDDAPRDSDVLTGFLLVNQMNLPVSAITPA
ncbi:TPA: hypothetical protein ACKQDN_004960 [Serratia marcescens]